MANAEAAKRRTNCRKRRGRVVWRFSRGRLRAPRITAGLGIELLTNWLASPGCKELVSAEAGKMISYGVSAGGPRAGNLCLQEVN